MCRLFGFRSVFQSQVHASLVGAENALRQQAEEHPDGWGVAYYLGDTPHNVKSVSTAVDDHLFQKVSGIVSSQTVLAHLRKATVGDLTIINTHPFQFGRWVFAHNGNIKNYQNLRPELIQHVDQELVRYILGTTDSEVIFFILLSRIHKKVDVLSDRVQIDDVALAIRETIGIVTKLAGPYRYDDEAPPTETFLSFILTNGSMMFGHQGGKELHYSTHKTRCPERDSCAFFAGSCESRVDSGPVNHLILSSEPLQGENVWQEMKPGELVAVDANLTLLKAWSS